MITDGKFIYELPCRFVNNMETVSQARMGSYHGKNENSNWKYVEPDLTFISCPLMLFLEVSPKSLDKVEKKEISLSTAIVLYLEICMDH